MSIPAVAPVSLDLQLSLDRTHSFKDDEWTVLTLHENYQESAEVCCYQEVLLSRKNCPLEVAVVDSKIYGHYLEPVINLANRDFLTNGSPPLSLDRQVESSYWQTFNVVCDSHSGQQSKEWLPVWEGEALVDYDWDKVKKRFCVVTFVSPGIIQWNALEPSSHGNREPYLNQTAHYLVCELQKSMNVTKAFAGVLTDGFFTLFLDSAPFHRYSSKSIYSGRFAVVDLSPTNLIAERVYTESIRSGLCTRHASHIIPLHQSALNLPSPHHATGPVESRSAFHIYTMQRDEPTWNRFISWSAEHDGAPFLKLGDTLAIEPNGLEGDHHLWKCRPRFAKELPTDTLWSAAQELPVDTFRTVTEHRRPRSEDIDGAFKASNSSELSFIVTGVLHSKKKAWSQIFLGVLRTENSDRQSGVTVCLKLYDERYFPLPRKPDYNQSDEPNSRLADMHCSEDIARREESVYTRLRDLQGSMIPHSYGFHKFTLPNGWKAYGMIMESIQCPSASNAGIEQLQEGQQRDFLHRLRHAVRALGFAGVSQEDWHLGQILCPRDPNTQTIFPVLIDFGFALQDFGETDYRPTSKSAWRDALVPLLFDLDLDTKRVVECWFPAVEEEY